MGQLVIHFQPGGFLMGQYNNTMNAGQSGWIHELARAEVFPEAEQFLDSGKSYDPRRLVEESTIGFMAELKDLLGEHVKIFNGYSDTGKKFPEARVYQVSQTAADFMIFRNQIKLVISNSGHGVIRFSFSRHTQQSTIVNGRSKSAELSGSSGLGASIEIEARVGALRDIYWVLGEDRVTPDQLARFYFTDFIRASRRPDSTKGGNKLLLKEIKTFLEQKGFDIHDL